MRGVLEWVGANARPCSPREFCLCLRLALLMYSLMTLNRAQEGLDLHQDNRLHHSEGGVRVGRG